MKYREHSKHKSKYSLDLSLTNYASGDRQRGIDLK